MSKKLLGCVLGGVALLVAALTGAAVNINIENGKVNATIVYSQEEKAADLINDRGEIIQTNTYDGTTIPTVEEVDGGLFQDKDTGVSVVEGMYSDLGWSETYNVSSPEAFRNDTIGKCIYANNYYGAQCVSLARVFWWSYADRDVSTCGTGMAKGMMNCWEENAGDEFITYWKDNQNIIQAGDWLIFDGGLYGHVGMALGPVSDGYVALLGENQGGRPCDGGGAATNIINISTSKLIGFYRPKDYVKPTPPTPPEPTPTPSPSEDDIIYVVKPGDTLGAIMRAHGYEGDKLYGDDGLCQAIANANYIEDRGLIFSDQTIVIYRNLLNAF